MKELTLAQSFSLIAFNAQDSRNKTVAKTVALRCVAAAVVLETWLDGSFQTAADVPAQPQYALYQETVLAPLFRNTHDHADLVWWLTKASALPDRQLKKLEHAIADSLKGVDLMTEIPNLLGCDMLFDSAGNTIKEYCADPDAYVRVGDGIRADTLEEGAPTDETVAMLWLLRESGCTQDLFSKVELEKMAQRMDALYRSVPLAQKLYGLNIYHGLERLSKSFLNIKRTVFRTQLGTGVVYAFPIFDRAQSIFIETEAWFESKEQRLTDVEARLTEKGHRFSVLRAGVAPMIKIDNIVYEAIPTAIGGKVPIQGMRLRRYPM